MRERILIVFIAIAIGLLITTLIFFLYQQTKTIPNKGAGQSSTSKEQATATPTTASYLVVEQPTNGMISDKRLIEVSGTTHVEDTIIVSTNQEDVVATPASNGKFTLDATIDTGANVVIIRSVAPDGVEVKETRVVTFSTEEF